MASIIYFDNKESITVKEDPAGVASNLNAAQISPFTVGADNKERKVFINRDKVLKIEAVEDLSGGEWLPQDKKDWRI